MGQRHPLTAPWRWWRHSSCECGVYRLGSPYFLKSCITLSVVANVPMASSAAPAEPTTCPQLNPRDIGHIGEDLAVDWVGLEPRLKEGQCLECTVEPQCYGDRCVWLRCAVKHVQQGIATYSVTNLILVELIGAAHTQLLWHALSKGGGGWCHNPHQKCI